MSRDLGDEVRVVCVVQGQRLWQKWPAVPMPVCPRPRVTVSSDVAAGQGLRVLPRLLPRRVHASGSCHWDLSVNDVMLSAPAEVGTSTRSSPSPCSCWLEEEESGARGDVRATRGTWLSGHWGAAARSRQRMALSGLCFEKAGAALVPGARGQRSRGLGLGGRHVHDSFCC